MTFFFRLLKTEIETKGTQLVEQVHAVNAGERAQDTFVVEPPEFKQIPGSPFAYWVSPEVLNLFRTLPPFENEKRVARLGDHPGSQDQHIRLFWEVAISRLSTARQWVLYQKGGIYCPYYGDIHLVVDWDLARETYFDFHGRVGRSSEHPSNYRFFFRPGLTWPRRTSYFGVRALPAGCIFADKGPSAFVEDDNARDLMALLSIMNSAPFKRLLSLQVARTQLAQSFDVGLVQQTPVPLLEHAADKLSQLALDCYGLTRSYDCANEITHAFCLPALAQFRHESLSASSNAVQDTRWAVERRLADNQSEIDRTVVELYGLPASVFASTADETVAPLSDADQTTANEEDVDETATSETADNKSKIGNLLMWSLGCCFGRWDVRFALNPSLLPKLQEPFDALPLCSPGMLIGTTGMPAMPDNIVSEAWLRARPDVLRIPNSEELSAKGLPLTACDYPLSIEWNGIIPDDESHPNEIIRRVREVVQLLWGDLGDSIEQEACQILDVASLREYFRQPRHFFDFHIKRYSKSHRKAPIYWLLQSKNRNYGIWLYYHRLTPDTLYRAAREYVDPKVKLEEQRLDDLRGNLSELKGATLRAREREISAQIDLLDEIRSFQKTVDRVALLNLKPDLNDGVLLNIAPLYELVPWKEAHKAWKELTEGKYAWSSISQQLRAKGLVKG
jgi:hypothetical protein